jgi:hypothetical protein
MSVPAIQEGNVGTVFVFTVRDQSGAIVNLATATTLDAKFRAGPKGTTFTRTGLLTTDGTDGKFQYVSIAGDLTPAHECWQRQGFVVLPFGEFETEVRTFAVKPNL